MRRALDVVDGHWRREVVVEDRPDRVRVASVDAADVGVSTEKLSSGSTVVSPLTKTLKVYVDSPDGIVAPVAEAAV